MWNSENNEASVPEIVEVESNTAASTSTDRMFEEDSDTSSEESVENRMENEHTADKWSSFCGPKCPIFGESLLWQLDNSRSNLFRS